MMLTKGMIMVIIGISGLIITLGIGIYTSRKYKRQLEYAESVPSNLSLSEQLTRKKETKTFAKSKKLEQSSGSIPLQPLPDFNLENGTNSVNSNSVHVHSDQNLSEQESFPVQEETSSSVVQLTSRNSLDEHKVGNSILNENIDNKTAVLKKKKPAEGPVQTPKSDMVAETTIMTKGDETSIMSKFDETLIMNKANETLIMDKADETLIMNKADETLIMDKADETLIMQLLKETIDNQQTTLLKQPSKTNFVEQNHGKKTQVLSKSLKK